MVAETIRLLNCEKCKLRTEHARTRDSITLVLWPNRLQRVDYGSSKFKCLKCGRVRVYTDEKVEEYYPIDDEKTSGGAG
jgi:transposase